MGLRNDREETNETIMMLVANSETVEHVRSVAEMAKS
jgi:hypothetical protein